MLTVTFDVLVCYIYIWSVLYYVFSEEYSDPVNLLLWNI